MSPSASHASVVLDGKIYAMGGFDGGQLCTVEVYDLGRQLAAGGEYAAGLRSRRRGGATRSIDWWRTDEGGRTFCVYDPQADAWTQLANGPGSAATSAAVGEAHARRGGRQALAAEVYDRVRQLGASDEPDSARSLFMAAALSAETAGAVSEGRQRIGSEASRALWPAAAAVVSVSHDFATFAEQRPCVFTPPKLAQTSRAIARTWVRRHSAKQRRPCTCSTRCATRPPVSTCCAT